MNESKGYYRCTTRNHTVFHFQKRCNWIDLWGEKMICFYEKNFNTNQNVVLAIIPIDLIAAIENINAPEV